MSVVSDDHASRRLPLLPQPRLDPLAGHAGALAVVRKQGRAGWGVVRRLGLVAALAVPAAGCILKADLPDPAIDMPQTYKFAGRVPAAATPALDWWRAFRSPELTALIEEAQTVNLDIAAATARIVQADAQARLTGAALLPTLSGAAQDTRSKSSGASSSGLTNVGRPTTTYSTSLSASYEIDFWGKNRDATLAAEETANANRFDRDVVALTTYAAVANAYFQVLASQDRIRIARQNIASAQRIYDAIKQRLDAGTMSDLDLASRRACSRPSRQRCRRCDRPSSRTSTRWRHWWRGRPRACASAAAR